MVPQRMMMQRQSRDGIVKMAIYKERTSKAQRLGRKGRREREEPVCAKGGRSKKKGRA